jgi:predicted DCC family thiol-disulfide oxidoreductase YuxK
LIREFQTTTSLPDCLSFMTEKTQIPVVIYDGDCKLCQRAVRFLNHSDTDKGIKFVPSSHPSSEPLFTKYAISKETADKTVIFIENKKVYTKSTAIIKALQKRGGLWRISGIFLLIPPIIRNLIYDWIARRRNATF